MHVVSLLTEADIARYLSAHGRPTRPRPPHAFLFPRNLIECATKHLRENGEQELEQLVLWGGYPTTSGVVIASLLLPDTEAEWGWVHILPSEQPMIAEWLRARGQLLFAEAHTHGDGPRATEISEEDRRHPAGRKEGFLTIIVPGYARNGVDFAHAGVWECNALEWNKVPVSQVRQRLRSVPDEEARDALH